MYSTPLSMPQIQWHSKVTQELLQHIKPQPCSSFEFFVALIYVHIWINVSQRFNVFKSLFWT